jgi:hypothetical protein
MKRIIKISLFLLRVLLIFGCVNFFSLSNLKPDNMEYSDSQDRAKKLLEEMGKAHGIKVWDSVETYNVIYQDEFYGFLGKQSHPFKEQQLEFSLNYIPKTFNGQLESLTGKEKGVIWGVQSGQTYEKPENGNISLNQNKDMKFWIPTYQYFIEFPYRIQEATAMEYQGNRIKKSTFLM